MFSSVLQEHMGLCLKLHLLNIAESAKLERIRTLLAPARWQVASCAAREKFLLSLAPRLAAPAELARTDLASERHNASAARADISRQALPCRAAIDAKAEPTLRWLEPRLAAPVRREPTIQWLAPRLAAPARLARTDPASVRHNAPDARTVISLQALPCRPAIDAQAAPTSRTSGHRSALSAHSARTRRAMP